jgi:hypothetical protein
MTTIAAFEIVVWIETHGTHTRRIADRHGPRMVRDLREALDHHDSLGRTYRAYGFSSSGAREELTGARLAAIRAHV